MKSKDLLIAALVTFSVAFNAVAEEDPRNARLAVVPVKGSEVFKVIYKGETSTSRVRLNIYNSSSELVFTEVHHTDGFIRPLNFAGLKQGEYTIEIVDGGKRKVEKVTYAPVPVNASKKVVHISKVVQEQGKFIVAISDASNEAITVRILDRNDNVIYSETREVNGSFAQIYRVKDATGVRFEIYDASGLNKSSRF